MRQSVAHICLAVVLFASPACGPSNGADTGRSSDATDAVADGGSTVRCSTVCNGLLQLCDRYRSNSATFRNCTEYCRDEMSPSDRQCVDSAVVCSEVEWCNPPAASRINAAADAGT